MNCFFQNLHKQCYFSFQIRNLSYGKNEEFPEEKNDEQPDLTNDEM